MFCSVFRRSNRRCFQLQHVAALRDSRVSPLSATSREAVHSSKLCPPVLDYENAEGAFIAHVW